MATPTVQGKEIEVTPEMIEAGVRAYYENAVGGWENPGQEELRDVLAAAFKAMIAAFPEAHIATNVAH